jgi:predicted transcriptional regulator
MDIQQWAKLQEILLKSQLKAVREFLKDDKTLDPKPRKKVRSQMSIVYDILAGAKQPLHVTDIITRAKQDFNVDLDRESIVSALTKKIKSGKMFKRVHPNTFAVLDPDSDDNSLS